VQPDISSQPRHPVEKGSVMAALAWMVFWAVGIGLFFVSQFWPGLVLCLVSIVGTIWIFSSEIRVMRPQNFSEWPWLGLFFIALQISITSWAAYSHYDTDCTDVTATNNKSWNVGTFIHVESSCFRNIKVDLNKLYNVKKFLDLTKPSSK
jgi:hypothetical protein